MEVRPQDQDSRSTDFAENGCAGVDVGWIMDGDGVLALKSSSFVGDGVKRYSSVVQKRVVVESKKTESRERTVEVCVCVEVNLRGIVSFLIVLILECGGGNVLSGMKEHWKLSSLIRECRLTLSLYRGSC